MRVERLRAAYVVEIKFVQFPLHPETPEEGLTLEQLFAGRNIDIPAAQARMAQLMADEGLPYGSRTMTYNSRLAQELAKWAETKPGGEAIHDALFRAYFVEGQNIALIENLIAIAEKIGLDGNEAAQILTGRQFKNSVDQDWERCRALGVTGVPTFVIGNQGVVGAQPYEVLEQFLLESGGRPREV